MAPAKKGVTSLLLIACLSLACETWGGDAATRAKTDLEKAEIALARGEVEEASRLFERSLSRSPRNTRALVGSARAHLAAGRGVEAVDRFAAYRKRGGSWRRSEHHDHCLALVMAAEHVLDGARDPVRADALARQVVSEDCDAAAAEALLLRSGLQLADRERDAGHSAKALELYRRLVEPRAAAHQANEKARSDVAVRYDDPDRARAYLEASRLMLAAGQRDEALAMLSQGLGELPGNRDLVHLMVTVLAEGSNVVFPRAKPPETGVPAAPR